MNTPTQLNLQIQTYKDYKLRLFKQANYKNTKAKHFGVIDSKKSVWIPNRHLEEDGTIIAGKSIDFVFEQAGLPKPQELELDTEALPEF